MKVVIFHGWGASSRDNWFPWLKKEMLKKGIDVECPDMPNPQYPLLDEWMSSALGLVDDDTVLVGHSLGTALILRILEKRKARAAFLVSAFDKDLGIDEIAGFTNNGFDYDSIKSNCRQISIFQSDDDPFIPLGIATALSKKLRANLKVYNNLEHLSGGTGHGKFPELRDMIYEVVQKV